MWQLGAGQMKLLVSGEADNRGGWIQSGGALWLKSGYLNNPGGTLMSSAHGSLFLHAERGTNNVYGHLQGSRDVTLKSNKLDNQGVAIAGARWRCATGDATGDCQYRGTDRGKKSAKHA